LRKLQEFYFAKCSNYFLSWPTVEKEPLHKWKPTMMAQAEAAGVAVEEAEADHRVAKKKEKEAREVAKVVEEVKEAK